MSFVISLIVSFFLSLKWITNKKLLLNQNNSWDQIVAFRYFIALLLSIFIYYFYPNNNSLTIELFILMFCIWLFDFLWSYLTQKYTKLHPNSSFQNFLWSFIPVAYIPIWVLFLWEKFSFWDFIWLSFIILALSYFTRFKELNFYSPVLIAIVIWRLFNIYLIWKYISIWWYFLDLLIFIYIFVLWTYFIKYFFKRYQIIKLNKYNYYDAIFFSIWSIGSFFLYELFASYEVKLFLLSTFLFNVILFKIFYQEEFFYKKLFLSFVIIAWLLIMQIF